MTVFSSLSLRLFGFLVSLYPEDLQRDYGAEMAFVFGEDLNAARRGSGLRGAMGVWRRALVEFIQLAPPGWASQPALRVPALTVPVFLAMLSSVTAGGGNSPAGSGVFDGLRAVLLLPLFSPPLILLLSILSAPSIDIDRLGLPNRSIKE